jgi:hypothetical protein
MPFDSSGVFTRSSNSFSEPVAGTIIDDGDAIVTFDGYDAAISRPSLTIITSVIGSVTVSATEGGVAINQTVGAPCAVTLPLASTRGGLPVIVKDMKGDANTNNITVTPNVADVLGIDGNATDTININKGSRTYFPISTGWLKT